MKLQRLGVSKFKNQLICLAIFILIVGFSILIETSQAEAPHNKNLQSDFLSSPPNQHSTAKKGAKLYEPTPSNPTLCAGPGSFALWLPLYLLILILAPIIMVTYWFCSGLFG